MWHPGDSPKAKMLACVWTLRRVGGAASETVIISLRTQNELGGGFD